MYPSLGCPNSYRCFLSPYVVQQGASIALQCDQSKATNFQPVSKTGSFMLPLKHKSHSIACNVWL